MYAVTGRIEKGYRLMGAELESEYNPVEAGLARPKVKSADFIGKDAYLAARDGRARSATSVHAGDARPHVSADGIAALPDRRQRADPHRSTASASSTPTAGVSRVTTAGAAPSLDSYLLLAYLPPEHAVEGNELRVMYMNELFPVTRRERVGSQTAVRPRRQRG